MNKAMGGSCRKMLVRDQRATRHLSSEARHTISSGCGHCGSEEFPLILTHVAEAFGEHRPLALCPRHAQRAAESLLEDVAAAGACCLGQPRRLK